MLPPGLDVWGMPMPTHPAIIDRALRSRLKWWVTFETYSVSGFIAFGALWVESNSEVNFDLMALHPFRRKRY